MTAPLGLIAGLGDLPVSIAENAVQIGQGVYVLRLKGFEEPRLASYPGAVVGLGELGKLFSLLKTAGCKDVLFAGIVKRPNFKDLKLDLRGAALLPKVIAEAGKGDDALLRLMVKEIEKQGFNVIGSDVAHAGLLAPNGLIAGPAPTDRALADISRGAHVVAALGDLDIGQGCVVCDGLVLAVEAQEGTDAMLTRCATLPETVRGTPAARRGVLVKRPKPGQERRIDLPTVGVSTVELVAAAGLAGLAVEAEGALMLRRAEMEVAAERLGVFIYGFEP
ncbi:MAG: UDP-2,3-diacylglucosamine diphosphatase LpxI [Alphaproteobacteria bacterium]|nr:UDP-2,3-diacylglucosamine diphosphatase LpxI [Alphaproteobacteria bacterium]MBU2085390.1 UDP-2,3-diacylglucosamine diphosphatase LpxI [Alphaproteobacteria bacterium]MBU2141871.1 UDP-2,3-diacylglucosamine diphosphatase LpxI [Alphaproteobacteria bacterium]MBU2195757.1 UDP-2,3-diacylglucosamine diphosphatase LpxI [Alphaproteobacteria bacterium]